MFRTRQNKTYEAEDIEDKTRLLVYTDPVKDTKNKMSLHQNRTNKNNNKTAHPSGNI